MAGAQKADKPEIRPVDESLLEGVSQLRIKTRTPNAPRSTSGSSTTPSTGGSGSIR